MTKNLRVETSGGLGNQLFSYFLALYLKSFLSQSVTLDLLHADRSQHYDKVSLLDFRVDESIHFLNLNGRSSTYKRLHTKLFSLNALLLNIEANPRDLVESIQKHQGITLGGDYGTFAYFDSLPGFRKSLELRESSRGLTSFLKRYSEVKTQSIHHRLGDFLEIRDSVGLLGRDFYRNAIQRSGPHEKLFIFSNEPDSSEYMFRSWGIHLKNMVWVETNQFLNPAENLIAMSRSSSIICANSTFSFWAAKFSNSTNIFFPKQYRRDGLSSVRSLPKHWKPIDSNWVQEEVSI